MVTTKIQFCKRGYRVMKNSTSANKEPFEICDPHSVRSKAGLDLAEMANLMGMSEAGYEAWEKGTRRPGGPAFKLLYLLDNNPKEIVAQLSRLKSGIGEIETQ